MRAERAGAAAEPKLAPAARRDVVVVGVFELWSSRRTMRFGADEAVGCMLDVPGAARLVLRSRARPELVSAAVAIDATGHGSGLARTAALASRPGRIATGVEQTRSQAARGAGGRGEDASGVPARGSGRQ